MARDDQLSTVDGLAQLAFLVHGTLERQAAARDLSIIQTRLLGVLRDRVPTINELAALLELDKSSVSGLVDRAARRGLVERVPSATDRRAVQVRLTRAGRALVTKVAATFEDEVTVLLAVLPAAERRTFTRLVSQVLVAHAEAHGVDLFALP